MAASAYAQLAGANFTGASVGGVAVSRKYVGTVTGNAASTQFVFNHNLSTLDITVQIYQTSSSPDTQWEDVEVDVIRTSTSVVTVTFAAAPSTGVTYNVVMVG